MAVCKLNSDILKSDFCGYSLKQIVDLYIANSADVTSTTIGQPTEGKGVEVKTITLAASAKYYHVEPAKNTATYTDELQVTEGGSKYRQATITWNIAGSYNSEMVDILDALSLGRFNVVAKLSDGSYVMFGRIVPVEATVASLQSEAAADGFNGISVTMQNQSNEAALPLSEDAIKTVLGTV